MPEAKTMRQLAEQLGLKVYEYQGDDPVEEGQGFRYGELKPISIKAGDLQPDTDVDLFVFVPSAEGSDYAGDVTSQANYRAVLRDFDEHPQVHTVHGGHGTYAIAIDIDTDDENLLELVQDLHDYPIYDESYEGEYQVEKADEDWEGWADSDFQRAVREKVEGTEAEEIFDDTMDWLSTKGHLRWGFEQMREGANVYWEIDGPSMTVNVEEVATEGDPQDLLAGVLGFTTGPTTGSQQSFVLRRLADALQKTLGSKRIPTDREIDAIIMGLWMEGVQPELVVPPFDESSVQAQLKDAGVSEKSIEQLAELLGREPEREQAYMALADAWWVYHALWSALGGVGDLEGALLLLHNAIPQIDQVQPVIDTLTVET